MDSDVLRQRLAEAYREDENVELVYLFGSQATGTAGPGSDYDFGVLVARDVDPRTMAASVSRVLGEAVGPAQVDTVVLNEAPVELAYAVIAQGQVLYERSVLARVEYEARILSLYGDYLPVLRAQRREIIEGDGYGDRVQRYRKALGRTRRTLGQIARPPGGAT